MSKAYRKHFSSQISELKGKDEAQLLGYLSVTRSHQSPLVYPDLMRAFSETAPTYSKRKFTKGQKEFKDLIWNNQVSPNTLENELSFALALLEYCVPSINEFQALVNKLQKVVFQGDFAKALNLLANHRSEYGYSIWGIELEYAVASFAIPNSEQRRRYLTKLTDKAPRRIAALLAQVVNDRNDQSISVGAFFKKCAASFPHLGLRKPIQEYMRFRATGEIKDVRLWSATLLTIDFNNSIFDYYETLIEICTTIVSSQVTDDLIISVKTLTEGLIQIGIKDIRLNRLAYCCGGRTSNCDIDAEEAKEIAILVSAIYRNDVASNDGSSDDSSDFLRDLLKQIDAVNLRGSVAQTEILQLVKFGLNFRGLPIGRAIHGFAGSAPNSISVGNVCSPSVQLATNRIRFEDLLAFAPGRFELMCDSLIATGIENEIIPKACKLIELINEGIFQPSALDTEPHALIYLARELVKANRIEDAEQCAEQLDKLSTPWDRHALKLRILCAIESGDLKSALNAAAKMLAADSGYGYELPLAQLFYRARWPDFKDFDPVFVAVVAHHAFYVTDDSNTRYICRMACRMVRQQGLLESLPIRATAATEDERNIIIQYLSEIWVEDNLTMAGYDNTEEIRRTRIQVLQILLQLVPDDRSGIYADEIKELTFNEMVSKGLKHIDSSRIFVNEGAIARWAEKELSADFDRWQTLNSFSYSSVPELDEILKGYLLGDGKGLTIVFRHDRLSEAEATLMNIVDRLLNRFLFDPADGLNCYLSSRIRHGSLKGILLGPLEEAGLLGLSATEISNDWRIRIGQVTPTYLTTITDFIHNFDCQVNNVVKRLVSETVQIRSKENPQGMIFPTMDSEFAVRSFTTIAKENAFAPFVLGCFEMFWLVLTKSINTLAEHIRQTVKEEIQAEFDSLILKLQSTSDLTVGLTTSLKTVATETQGQCDVVANWFQLGGPLDKQIFSLEAAIEIAKKGTQYVYRTFPISAVQTQLPSESFSLTSLALSAISDCLYIMLENSFKHSGLRADLPFVKITSEFSASAKTLSLSVTHPVSPSRLNELENGGLDEIRKKFIENASVDQASFEGGSGFAKLKRLTRTLDQSSYPAPLTIDSDEKNYITVHIVIPVYQRGEAYDAYFG